MRREFGSAIGAVALLWAANAAAEEPVETDGAEVIVIEDDRHDHGVAEAGTASVRVVGAEDIELLPARSADDVLRLVPGLHISQHASEGKAQQFFVRGFDAVHGADLELKVGGVVINEPSNVHGHGYIDVGFVMPEVIAEMHAHKGSFLLSQGPFGTAGTVEIELGVRDRGHRVSYEIGTTNRHRVLALSAPQDAPDQTFVAIEAMTDNGFGQNRRSERGSALGQHRFTLGRRRHLDVFTSAYAARFGEPGPLPLDAVESGDFDFDDASSMDTDGTSQRLLTGARLSDTSDHGRLELGLSLGLRRLVLAENFTGFLENEEMGDTRGQRHDAATIATHARLERDLDLGKTKITWAVGAGGRIDNIEQREDRLDTMGAVWMESRDLSATLLGAEALAGVRVSRGPARVELGARADALHISAIDNLTNESGDGTVAQLSPRLATSYAVGERVNLFAAYGRGVRAPEARSVVATDGETGMTRTDAVEIGARIAAGEHVSIGATGFGTWMDREFVFDHMSGRNVARNATRRLGVELDATAEIGHRIELRGDLSLTDARFVESGAAVPYAPTLLASAETRVRISERLSAGAQFVGVGPRPLAHGATGEPTLVANLKGTYRTDWFDLGLQIDNLWDAQWREGEYHYASRFELSQPASQLPKTHIAAGRPFGARASFTARF